MSGASKILSSHFIDYLIHEKAKDPDASIPEIIRRAKLDAIIKGPVSRTSVWRAARRLNLPIFADKAPTASDMRRFAYAHRMQMVLTDGKHFRVGTKRKRRVVMTFLDDATRFALCAVVGTSERTELFTRGLWSTLSRWGLFSAMYVDNGPAFIAKDAVVIFARLNIALIHGAPDYPEGRGKIERFHQTLEQDLLRSFDGNPEIDPCEKALELRINHYLQHLYNPRHHESLGCPPQVRFLEDTLALRVDNDMQALRKHFILKVTRKVSRDNVVKVRGIFYEMPRGYAGRRIELYHHLLDLTVSCIHEEKYIVLKPVDTLLNALSHRAKADADKPKPRPTTSAAGKLFHRHYPPIVGTDGGFPEDKE
jgi:transposase InsO family protein